MIIMFAFEHIFHTVGQVCADLQLVVQELFGLKGGPVQCVKQNHSQLPHCGRTGSVGTTTVPLWGDVSRGS